MHPPAQFVQEPLLQHGDRELAEAVLDDVLPGALLEALDLCDRVAADHHRVVPLGICEGRGDDVLGHRVDVVAEGVAGASRPDRREAVVGVSAHDQGMLAGRRPLLRPPDHAVEGDVGGVDDLAHSFSSSGVVCAAASQRPGWAYSVTPWLPGLEPPGSIRLRGTPAQYARPAIATRSRASRLSGTAPSAVVTQRTETPAALRRRPPSAPPDPPGGRAKTA